jgi:phytanoyl-CoA hydroxylase
MAPSTRQPPPPSSDLASGLTSEQQKFWDRNGYLIIPDALSPSTVSSLLSQTHELLSSFDLSSHPMTKFSTGGEDGEGHVGDDYFLTSGDKVRFFFEEDAFSSSGQLLMPKERAINKIGHYLHELSPSFKKISLNATNAAVARSLGFGDPRCLQSMIICKQPEIGAAVRPHQDSTFLYTNPPSAVGFWYALEDATISNGCLSLAAGSHRRAPIRQRFVRAEGGRGTTFADNDGAKFPPNLQVEEEGEETKEDYTIGEVKAGTLVLIHGNILHKSEKNLSGKSRFIYTFHVIEGEHEYDERNWLQPPKEGFSRLYA